ncbi:MAG: helix-turn-helix domain-containing protein [Clostridia bacterium]|nr:helix-turn-helix domain-containing protein [Clostridia bacterium]
MNQYVTGAMIKRLREEKKITQQQLAEIMNVSDKAVSKWETGRGYPDITLIEPLAEALGVSVIELFSGEDVVNTNKVSNMLHASIYVCPICGNVIQSTGNVALSCCGVTLPALEAEEPDGEHQIKIETIEDEYYVSLNHPMTKEHYISFFVYRTGDRIETVKLYPEGNAECRFFRRGRGEVYAYCNRHGLFRTNL